MDQNERPGVDRPGPRADVEPRRERTDIRLKCGAGPVSGEMEVSTDSAGGSSTALAVTTLILVAAACLPALLTALVFWLVHFPSLPLVCVYVGMFVAVFVTCTTLVVRWAGLTGHAQSPRSAAATARHGSPGTGHGKVKAARGKRPESTRGTGKEALSRQRAR